MKRSGVFGGGSNGVDMNSILDDAVGNSKRSTNENHLSKFNPRCTQKRNHVPRAPLERKRCPKRNSSENQNRCQKILSYLLFISSLFSLSLLFRCGVRSFPHKLSGERGARVWLAACAAACPACTEPRRLFSNRTITKHPRSHAHARTSLSRFLRACARVRLAVRRLPALHHRD